MNWGINMKKILTSLTVTTLILMALGTTFIFSGLGNPSEISFADITLSNEQIQLLFTDEAVGIGNYTDDTVEPKGWDLFPSLYWDANGNEIFDDEEQMVSTVFPTVHFTENAQGHTFSPLNQSIMQDPGDAEILYSGWISEPNIYASEVKDYDELVTINSTISIYDGNNYFTQKIDVTSTASTTMTDVVVIVYLGIDVQGFFDDYAFIDTDNNNMIKAKDNLADVWFGAYPTTPADTYEIDIWDDGPSNADDLWQHCLQNNLNGQDTADDDVEGALLFDLSELSPGENKSITLYYSFALNEYDLYPQTPPPTTVYVSVDYCEGCYNDGHTWGYDAFDNIQDGVDTVLETGTVIVYNGTYYENVVVDKQINLTGEDKYITIVDGTNTSDVFLITAESVNISGFTITNEGYYNGIHLDHVGNSNINDLIITENENGILLESSSYNSIENINASFNADDGIDIWQTSDYNTIYNNDFMENGAAVFLNDNCQHNDIQFNTVLRSTAFGIQLYDGADYNTISNNTIIETTNTTYGDICGDAICLFYYSSDPIYGCIIENNEMTDNIRGVTLRQTHDTIIRNNDIENCTTIGMEVFGSSTNNDIYHNNFYNNPSQATDGGTNTWDDGYPSGGNYWDDYSGVDFYHGPDQDILGSDNIGDTSYDVSGGSNQDHYPLMHPLGVEGFYLNLADFPMYEAESVPGYQEMCGPAVAQMTLDYIWWNSSQDPSGPPELYDQSWLYERGLENNTNQSTPYLDTYGLWKIIQYNKPMPYSEYGYNFMKYNNENLDEMLKRICLWINYTIGSVGGYKPGHPLHVPAVVPAYGDYTNWMAIRGFHANRTAHPMPDELTVYGFWVNDPYPSSVGGLGENSYKTLAQWLDDYYLPLETDDVYDGKYVAIFEPPQSNDDARLNIGVSPPRFTPEEQRLIRLVQSMPDAVSDSLVALSSQWIVQAAVEGVAEQLIPYDDDFAAVFAKTLPGTPIFVKSLGGDGYYAVPFNSVVEKRQLKSLSKPVRIEDQTVIVILIDASDGSFKEASWVKDPAKYLPISKSDVQEILPKIFEEMGIELVDLNSVIIDLVHSDSTPYYPDWRVTIKELELEFFIGQDGTIVD